MNTVRATPSRPERAPGSWSSSADRPIDVTIVAHDIGPVGGMERVLSELIAGLRGRGHRVTVIARTCELPAELGVSFHRVRGPGRPFLLAYPWFLLAGSLATRRWRRGVLQVTGAIVFNRADVVAVHYCHQAGPSTPSRSTWLFRAHIRVAGLLSRFGERTNYRANRSAKFACVSNGVADEMREYFPYLADRVFAVHNGVDTAGFTPDARREEAQAMRVSLGIPPDRLVAIFVGGEWGRKGLRLVIEALASAPEWDLLVVGAGDERAFQALASSVGVAGRVHWAGVTREVQVLYQMANAFVLPTSYETFSLATFEAAASGLAILATPVNGVRELISDGHNGFIIARDPLVIATRLRELAGDPELRMRIGNAARQSSLEFGWDRTVSKYEELYDS
jgi:UDP-glucose:(heptosyl)LPS alpha-1,3-glucosyltransferase